MWSFCSSAWRTHRAHVGSRLSRDLGCESWPSLFSRNVSNVSNVAFWLLDRMKKSNIFGKQVRVHLGRINWFFFSVYMSLRLRHSLKFIREQGQCFLSNHTDKNRKSRNHICNGSWNQQIVSMTYQLRFCLYSCSKLNEEFACLSPMCLDLRCVLRIWRCLRYKFLFSRVSQFGKGIWIGEREENTKKTK